MLRHVILSDHTAQRGGFEYAVQRAFEDEIVRQTGAEIVLPPQRWLPRFLDKRLHHGTRYGGLRRWVPRVSHSFRADVLWVPLMGPEGFELDWFKDWDRQVGCKILYIFDTFESQLPIVPRITRAARWNLAITSFADAVPMLERASNRPWLALPQAVPLDNFKLPPRAERVIAFSAYGRRHPRAHESMLRFSKGAGLHYDFSLSAAPSRDIETRDLGRFHAWHLCHSAFTFCWPVEVTSPRRVRTFSPATCRWFEAAAAGAVIVGRQPGDSLFPTYFGSDLVHNIDIEALSSRELDRHWGALWERRDELLDVAAARRQTHGHLWSWESRVRRILELAGLTGSGTSRGPSLEGAERGSAAASGVSGRN